MEDTLRTLQTRFNQAELDDDRVLLQELMAESFVSIGPKGFLLSKQQWIDRHEHFTYHSLESSDYRIQAYETFGIVISRHENQSEFQGSAVHFVMRETQVWQLSEDVWHIVCLQFSPMDNPA